jgi:DNA-binding transcriptional MerR regulator
MAMAEAMAEKVWRIGDLARQTGLTVRALHHYDEIGLLVPTGRTASGHRLYSETDVRKLYHIMALRQLGLALGDIGSVLAGNGSEPRALLRRQLAALERQGSLIDDLRNRLTVILDALDKACEPSAKTLVTTLEVMTRMEKFYTPEQLAQLSERRRKLGDEAIADAEQQWAELIAGLDAEHKRGTDPSKPRVQELARRWKELIEAFTGGDEGIRRSLQTMYEQEGPEQASRGTVSSELADYARRAHEAGGANRRSQPPAAP